MTKRSEKKREIRERQVAWLRRVIEHTKLTPSALATAAGLADLTLTRFLNQPDYEGVLSPLSVRLLVEHTGLPGPNEAGTDVTQGGRFGFSEGEQFDTATASVSNGLGQAVRLLIGGRVGATAWELHTNALEGAGYLPGDIVIVDLNVPPKPHSAVCAQAYDLRGSAETLFRIYEPPILTGATFDAAQRPRPLVVDNVAVKIMGVITHSIRAPARG